MLHKFFCLRVSSLRRILFLGSLLFFLWLGQFSPNIGAGEIANASNESQLVQQGVESYQAGDYFQAINHWQQAIKTFQATENRFNRAIVAENLARAYQQIGRIDEAIAYWQQAIEDYQKLKYDKKQIGRILTEQAQAYSSIGQPWQAIALLCGLSDAEEDYNKNSGCVSGTAIEIAYTTQDELGKVAALGSLGKAYRQIGDYNLAIENLGEALNITKKIGDQTYTISLQNILGNVYTNLAQIKYRRANSAQSIGDKRDAAKLEKEANDYADSALKSLQTSLELARIQADQAGELRVLLNIIPLADRTSNSALATESLAKALSLLKDKKLPNTREKVYAAINLAYLQELVANRDQTFDTFSRTECFNSPQRETEAEKLFERAREIAVNLKDNRSHSFALGELGKLYECRHDYQQALKYTEEARWRADQELLAQDSLYLWEWQAGRIFHKQANELNKQGQEKAAREKESQAIEAYERAIAILEGENADLEGGIRSDILNADRDLQFDFRDTVAPLYRQFAELMLEQAALPPKQAIKSQEVALKSVRQTLDSLQLAELQNYFGNECLLRSFEFKSVEQLTKESAQTAFFSSIILKNCTAIIVTLPNRTKLFKFINIDNQTLRKKINEFRQSLEDDSEIYYDTTQAEQLYQWIIAPFTNDLQQANIKNLVFSQDGILRSIPMAALHDGKHFLVENYAIATTPSLNVTSFTPLDTQRRSALILGLTESAQLEDRVTYPVLNNAPSELKQIQELFPDNLLLKNDKFTRQNLQNELAKTSYPIIHLTTHGQFGTDPEDAFLVTGKNPETKSHEKLTITELENSLRSIRDRDELVELLVLTACQTAVGDERAALGLAGVAVQAGVSSAIASLWYVPDDSTEILITQFYRNWQQGMSKAEALKKAQSQLIQKDDKYAHPLYWAPFILIGNWV